MSDIGPSANRRFAFIQPIEFFAGSGVTTALNYVVPAGLLAVVLGINAIYDASGTGPLAELQRIQGVSTVVVWASYPAAGTVALVEPRHNFIVFPAGTTIRFQAVFGTWDVQVSGLLIPA